MKTARLLLILIGSLAFSYAAFARNAPESFAPLVEDLMPAVVNISTSQTVQTGGLGMQFHGLPNSPEFAPFHEFFKRFGGPGMRGNGPSEREVTSLGSGFVIDPTGYIVTNNHVIEKADKVSVTFPDKTEYEANIIGRDPKTDLALLRIETDKKLPYVKFGNSDEMKVGDWVIAIGNPFGLGGSVSAGIVSARSRDINAGPFDDFIQTDAAINRGNSGGPLFNADGKVIGINSAIFSPSGGNIGIGFAIPTALAEPILAQLREHGRTHRGWLGVKIQYVTEEIAESLGLKNEQGAVVLEVTEDSPAAKGGIEAGDVILSFDGRDIDEMRDLPRIVAETEIGKRIEVEVWRNGRKRTLKMKLGELEEEDQTVASSDDNENTSELTDKTLLGMQLATIDANVRRQMGIKNTIEGVAVVAIKSGSVAAKSGIRPRDVILQANQSRVEDIGDLESVIKAARNKKRDYILLRVMRRGMLMFLTLPLEE